jgi:hypothetical protein
MGGVQLPAGFRNRRRLVSERDHGRTWEYAQASDLRQLGRDVFRDAITKELLFTSAAQILQ